MTYFTLDFSQSFPLIAAILFILSAVWLFFIDAKTYTRRGWNRESVWSRRMGWINLVCACLLLTAQWLHHQLWWL